MLRQVSTVFLVENIWKRKTENFWHPSDFSVLILSRLNLGRISSFKSGKSEDLSVVKIDPFAKHAFVLLCQTKKAPNVKRFMTSCKLNDGSRLVTEKKLGKLPKTVTAHVPVSLSSFCGLAYRFSPIVSVNGTNTWISKYRICMHNQHFSIEWV